MQKDYPRYSDVNWIGQITDIIADIIRNKRRTTFRREKKASNGPHRGRGRPPMSEEEKAAREARGTYMSRPSDSMTHRGSVT